tara:strand:+ start:373 stop:1293 length:921 start_codon:yes stop_codon:yes gene_type:complete
MARSSRVADSTPNNTNKQATTALAAALSNSTKTTSFPDNLDKVDHWMAFRINSSELLRKADFPVTSDIHRVFLPLPVQFSTAYNQSYASGGIGASGEIAANVGKEVNSAVQAGNIDSIKNKFNMQTLKEVGKKAADAGVAIGAGMATAIPGLGDIAKAGMAGAGIAVNPYLAMIYESPSLRTHQFNWKLVAKNYNESLNIYRIIKLFKYHSAPEISTTTGMGGLLKYPQQFDVDVHHQDYLYNIGPSVLTGMSVDYHPDGILYHVVEGGNEDNPNESEKLPVSVQLSITLQEVSIVTKTEIEKYDR